MAEKKPTPTQRMILENAAGIADHRPFGRSQHGGWSGSYVACHRNGWLAGRSGEITTAGLRAIGRAASIVLTVADHEQNGFVALAETSVMLDDTARLLIMSVDALVDDDAEPDNKTAAYAFVLDLMAGNGDCIDTGKRMLPAQIAMSLAPEAVSRWLEERPEPDTVINRLPMLLQVERFPSPTEPSGGDHE